MYGVRPKLSYLCRKLHTLTRDGPSDSLKRRIAELDKKKKKRNPRKSEVFVEVPEGTKYLDTPTLPMFAIGIGLVIFAKILWEQRASTAQERLERKIKEAPEAEGTVRMLSEEEWNKLQELRPFTPFESQLSRTNARIRTGEPLKMEDYRDWTVDVFTDAFTRAEEIAKRGSSS